MSRHFLFFCSQSYAIPILRPLQKEIESRGDHTAWFLENTCSPDALTSSDKRLFTKEEVEEWDPVAVFSPGDYTYYFFPGIKVMVFHGFPINKRSDANDVHFRIRGWYDIYCTQGPTSTPKFKQLEQQYGHFKVYETGWAKTDALVSAAKTARKDGDGKPTIFVATTFTSYVTQLRTIFPEIRRLAEKKEWNWLITMHPKLDDQELKAEIRQFAQSHDNVQFHPEPPAPELMAQTDVMLCDASSIILEYMLLDKPVVTFRNNRPGPQMINVTDIGELEMAIEKALERPQQLMDSMRNYINQHEAHRDGHNCKRIVDAVDDFLKNYKDRIRRKPMNIIRKMKIRKKYRKQRKS